MQKSSLQHFSKNKNFCPAKLRASEHLAQNLQSIIIEIYLARYQIMICYCKRKVQATRLILQEGCQQLGSIIKTKINNRMKLKAYKN